MKIVDGQVVETVKYGPFYMIEARIRVDGMMRQNVARLLRAVVEEVK